MSDTDILLAIRARNPERYDQVMAEMRPMFGAPETWNPGVARAAFLRIAKGDPAWAEGRPDAHWRAEPSCGDENCVTPDHAKWEDPD